MSNKLISFRIDIEQYKKLEEIAKEKNLSVGQYSRELVFDSLDIKNAENDNYNLFNLLQQELKSKNKQIEELQTLIKQEQALHLNLQKQLPRIEEDTSKSNSDRPGFLVGYLINSKLSPSNLVYIK